MSKEIENLKNNEAVTKSIHGAWPAIKAVLQEQLLISSSDDEIGKGEIKGITIAYRCLERFSSKGSQNKNTTTK